MFPRPAGRLRPQVHGQTLKYNMKLREGRGFSLEELKVLLVSVLEVIKMDVLITGLKKCQLTCGGVSSVLHIFVSC